MNAASETGLKTIVERVVRPVRTTTNRKRKMRDELLSHVTAVFEAEATKLGDEQAALQRTAERLGNPAELADQLQASLPRNERIDRFFEGPTDESIFRKAARIAALMSIPMLLMATLKLSDTASAAQTGYMLAYCVLLAAYCFGTVFTFFFFAAAMRKALFTPTTRASSKAFACGLACFAFYTVIIFLNCWQLHRRDPGELIALALWFGSFMVALQIILARLAAARIRYQQEWAELAVD